MKFHRHQTKIPRRATPPNIHQTIRESEIPTKSFTMSQTLFQSINFGQQAFERWNRPRNRENHPKEDPYETIPPRSLSNLNKYLFATWRTESWSKLVSLPAASTKDLNSRARDREIRRGLTGFIQSSAD